MKKNQMNRILYIFIIIILFSCKTPYDRNYVMQCNIAQTKKQKQEIENKKNFYIDSIFKSTMQSKDIRELTKFINQFPNHIQIENIKKQRKILFKDKENVINSGIDINKIIEKNPCYIPLYKNIDYVRNKNIKFEELKNSILPANNPYINRFIVADLNTLNENNQSRGIKEQFINLSISWEFKDLYEYIKEKEINIESIYNNDNYDFTNISIERKKEILKQIRLYKNYYNKVEKFEKEIIQKDYSSYNGYRYTGQNLCFCEIDEDTIILIAKHVTSARGKTRSRISEDTITGEIEYEYSEALPIGKDRKYYAAHYRISIKNWETERKYDSEDKFRDSLMGGGNSRVTFFDGESQLPNFLLMDPDKLYPRAMKMNGIHEGSLSNMSRCMLGTPQSLGCLRTTDYGSKFSRWWIPKYANLFVYFEEEKYSNSNLSDDEFEGIRLPFKNRREGNLFRKWVNEEYPIYAKEIDLEEEGSCTNCFIQSAWEKFYNEYINTVNGMKLDFTPPEIKNNIINDTIKENIYNSKLTNDSSELSSAKLDDKLLNKSDIKWVEENFKITEEYYIIIGCFKEEKNAKYYSKKITKKKYTNQIFFDENAKCNLVGIGPYLEIKKAENQIEKIRKNIEKDAWIYIKVK